MESGSDATLVRMVFGRKVGEQPPDAGTRSESRDESPKRRKRDLTPDKVSVPEPAAPRRADGVIVWAPKDARRASPPAQHAGARAGAKVDILFLSANPRSTSRLALKEEASKVFEKLERVGKLEGVKKLQREVVHAVRIDDLMHCLLRHQPAVVHFGGHGSKDGKLLLEDERGEAAPVSVAALGRLFEEIGGVRCVVLNACFSAEHASAIAQHVPCVVGMSTAIADAAAIAFAGAFYEALAFGEGVERAFHLACSGIDLHALPDAGVPRLLFREGVNPSDVRLFDDVVNAQAEPLPKPAPHPLLAVAAAVGLILVVMAILGAMNAPSAGDPSTGSPTPRATADGGHRR